jgi:hypothetical protein
VFATDFPLGPVMDIFSEIVSSAPAGSTAPTFDKATVLGGALQYIYKTGKK